MISITLKVIITLIIIFVLSFGLMHFVAWADPIRESVSLKTFSLSFTSITIVALAYWAWI